MKKYGFIMMVLMFFGLVLSGCQKEYLNNSASGNVQNIHKDGDGIDNDGNGIIDDEEDEDLDDGITDGGRDEDYDKSGKPKKPKPN